MITTAVATVTIAVSYFFQNAEIVKLMTVNDLHYRLPSEKTQSEKTQFIKGSASLRMLPKVMGDLYISEGRPMI